MVILQRVLVTGASGFVGRQLTSCLLKRNIEVRAVVRNTNTEILASRICLIPKVDHKTDWSMALQDLNVIFHLAARVHVMQDQAKNPLQEFLKVNLHATMNLARQAAAAGVKRFVYVSSIKVNGEHTTSQPFRETDTVAPQDPYAISKCQAEQALMQLARETGMEVVIVRPPLVYGPGVKANFLSLLRIASCCLPLPLASIRNQRSLIFVGNLVDSLILCASHPAAAGQVYLVSDGQAVSTPTLVRHIAHAMHVPALLWPFPVCLMRLVARLIGKTTTVERLTDSLLIDDSKIRTQLDWQPTYSLEQGIKLTVDWYLQTRKTQA